MAINAWWPNLCGCPYASVHSVAVSQTCPCRQKHTQNRMPCFSIRFAVRGWLTYQQDSNGGWLGPHGRLLCKRQIPMHHRCWIQQGKQLERVRGKGRSSWADGWGPSFLGSSGVWRSGHCSHAISRSSIHDRAH